jgi:DNA-binding NarL/FixJ family response regulator
MWQVLIVEDDPQTRDFFAASVSRSPALALVASVGTVADAVAWLQTPGQSIDVLLTDLGLPDGSGLAVIREAAKCQPACESLVISMFGDEINVLASIEAGALGYIHKDSTPEDIATSILEMKAGASPISPMIARRVLSKYVRLSAGAVLSREVRPSAQPSPAEGVRLTSSEQEVLELVSRGFSYSEIARFRAVSVYTVQSQIKSIYAKLAVSSRSEAVYEATQLGLLGAGR